MSQYRKKPVVIEARQFTVDTAPDVYAWAEAHIGHVDIDKIPASGVTIDPADGGFIIRTLEGDMRVDLGDYVICGVQGEFYPCKPDIFDATYEAVDA